MEKVIFITQKELLKYWSKKYNRIYFGIEFCQNLIPKLKEVQEVFEFTQKHGIGFSYVTPFVTEKGLKKLEEHFQYLKRKKKNIEIVINDLGILRLLSKKFKGIFTLILGRLLIKHKRDPTIFKFLDKIPIKAAEHFKQSNVNVPAFQEFLIKKDIRRVEMDNLLQGIGDDLSHSKIKASLYYPYAYLTTTRLCLVNSCDINKYSDRIGIFPCKRECQRYSFTLTHKSIPVDLFLEGNTLFFKNQKLPKYLDEKGINRIIYQPKIPL
ncbi:MAG: hypothetical protein ABIC04_01610 [Nanoarchaeota archaeon]